MAGVVLATHLAWIGWVVLGWSVTRGRPALRLFHIGSLVYGAAIEVMRFPCPLTLAELWLMRQAGITIYDEPFILHYLRVTVYPNIRPELLIWGGFAVCLSILAVYVNRFARRGPAGW